MDRRHKVEQLGEHAGQTFRRRSCANNTRATAGKIVPEAPGRRSDPHTAGSTQQLPAAVVTPPRVRPRTTTDSA